VASLGGIGIEDFLAASGTGAAVSLLAFWPVRHRLKIGGALRCLPLRYLGVSALCVAVHAACLLPPWQPEAGLFVGSIASCAILLAGRPNLWWASVLGGGGWAGLYTMGLHGAFRLWPHFRSAWQDENLCGLTLAGIPIEEYGWALAAGVLVPVFLARVLDIRLEMPRRNGTPACPETECLPYG
jgi:hypothetical protein